MHIEIRKIRGYIGNGMNVIQRRIRMPRKNKMANEFSRYYMDEESIRILKLRMDYNVCKGTRNERYTRFVDYINGEGTQINLVEEEQINRMIVVYNKKNRLLRYTIKVLRGSVYGKKGKFMTVRMKNAKTLRIKDGDYILTVMQNKKLDRQLNKIYGNRIYRPPYDRLIGQTGNQYFDVFEPNNDEIVIDAGACDGSTAYQFLKWGGGKIKKIYAFESDPANCDDCEKFINRYCDSRVQLIKKGCWNETKTLYLTEGEGTHGSRVGDAGNKAIEVAAIDDVVFDDKVTFIKMDIEGAELNALKGARKTILKNCPRLAICVYHKFEDIWEIPRYLLFLIPEYRFYLRHYTTTDWETVLYAFIP